MRVFSTFTGIGGFEIGIANAFNNRSAGQAQEKDSLGNDSTNDPSQHTWQPPVVVGYSEIDRYAISVYNKQFEGVKNYGDITKINADELPDFDCLVGGFPCQAFSVAGKRHGFEDTRGTLFFDLARILRAKQPRLFVFENVKGLLSHDNGRTFATIIATIDELGYDCQWQVLNSKDFGVPQNRERVFIVGHLRGTPRPEVLPITESNSKNIVQVNKPIHSNNRIYSQDGISPTLRTMQGGNRQPKVVQLTEARTEEAKQIRRESIKAGREYAPRRGKVLVPRKDSMANTVTANQGREGLVLTSKTVRAGGRGSPHGAKQNWDSYEIDGVIRRLTPLECERLQGFPDYWTLYNEAGEQVSDTQRYKMAGNAVTTNVVQAIFERIFDA